MRSLAGLSAALAAAAVISLAITGASAQENYDGWEVLQNPFPSTGGGGIMIGGYAPVIVGAKCLTDFTATEPNGTVYYSSIEFETLEVQGGTLCHNGKWRAKEGGATGTTTFRVFIKNGVVRRSP